MMNLSPTISSSYPTISRPRGFVVRSWLLASLMLLAPAIIRGQTLVQTINLAQSPGSAALTSIAVDPSINTLYVADGATTDVYLIDTTTNTVTATVYTAAFGTGSLTPTPPQFGVDGTPLGPGYYPNVVLANPVTHTWVWMGESEGVKFNGTTFDELIAAKAMHLAGAWDPVTDNMYFADSQEFWAVNNLKMLYVGFPCFASNAVAVNSQTNRVYISSSCGSIITYDGAGFTGFKNPAPAPLANLALGAQPSGLAVNPNTNRIYAAMVDTGTLDVIDASSFQVVATIPGLASANTNGATTTVEWLDMRAVSIAVNTVTNTIYAVNPGNSTVSVFDGNTNTLTGTITTPDGAVGAAVNEQTNTLYVANSAGTVSVYALDPPAAPPAFSVNGVIKDSFGVAQAGINVTATGAGGTATSVTDATGLFVLTGLSSGTYTIAPTSPAFSIAPQTITVNGANISGLSFVAKPPIVPVSYTLSPWAMVGPGVVTNATVTLNQPAPAGGAVVTLSASDTKSAKFPATVTVPAGQTQASFSVQGNGVSAVTTLTLKATYNGGSASTNLTVAPSDSLHITRATWSKSSQVLTVTATGTNAQATIVVQDGKTNGIMGTMVNLGGGSFSYQQTISSGVPTSVNIISNLGGKTGQGVGVIN